MKQSKWQRKADLLDKIKGLDIGWGGEQGEKNIFHRGVKNSSCNICKYNIWNTHGCSLGEKTKKKKGYMWGSGWCVGWLDPANRIKNGTK